MINLTRIAFGGLVLLTLAACGGGGGGAPQPPPPPPSPPAFTYTLELNSVTLDDVRLGASVSVTGLPIDGATVTVR